MDGRYIFKTTTASNINIIIIMVASYTVAHNGGIKIFRVPMP